jgi:MFS superfamily sulfate permease-like transporter
VTAVWAARLAVLERLVPGAAVLRGYRREWLRHDLLAGVTMVAYLVPQVMAYAGVAGLEPVAGLWAALPAMIVYALLGSSRQLSVGPESTTALMTATVVAPLAAADPARYAGIAAALAVVVGLLAFSARLLRLGFVADLLSQPIMVGYMAGVAAIMIVGQLERATGVPVEGDTLPDELTSFVRAAGDVEPGTAALTGAVLVFLFAVARFPVVPGPLLAVGLATAAVAAFDLDRRGLAVVGDVPSGLPVPALPPLDVLPELALPAVGVLLVGYSDNVLTARAFAARRRVRDSVRRGGRDRDRDRDRFERPAEPAGDRGSRRSGMRGGRAAAGADPPGRPQTPVGAEVDAQRELSALGGANVAAGLFGGFPVSSSGSRTAIGDLAGSRTQLYSLVAAAVVAGVLVFAGPLLARFPTAALGALVIYAAVRLVDVAGFRRLAGFRRSELLLALSALAGVVLFDVLYGILAAIALSVADLLARVSRPHDAILGRVPGLAGMHDVDDYEQAVTIPGLVVYRYDAPLFFANAQDFRRRALAAADGDADGGEVDWFVLNVEAIVEIDITALDALDDLRVELRRRGIVLAMARVKQDLLDDLRAGGFVGRIGADRLFPTLPTAVSAYERRRASRPPAGAGGPGDASVDDGAG